MVSTLIAIVMSASLAGAPSDGGFQEGVKAYEEMDLDGAADRLTRALRSSSSRERPRIELWLGIVELERGNEAAAKRWLRSALKASPRLTVKQELSPKIVATIDSIRDSVRAPPKKSAPSSTPAPVAPAPVATAPAVVAVAASPVAPSPVAPSAVAPSAVAPSAVAPSAVAPMAMPTSAAPMVTLAVPTAPTAPTAPNATAPIASAGIASAQFGTTSPIGVAPTATASTLASSSSSPSVEASEGDIAAAPLLLASAAAGALAVASLGGAAAFGVIASIGGTDAQQEERAALATKRYQDATTAATIANGLYVASGLAVVVGAVCGGIWLADEGES